MIWQSASDFWAMGGYGVYVWGSMGMSVALWALEVLLARLGRQQALDAVCEAMDAEALDAESPGGAVACPMVASGTTPLIPGAAT